jgi:hypothetical protein
MGAVVDFRAGEGLGFSPVASSTWLPAAWLGGSPGSRSEVGGAGAGGGRGAIVPRVSLPGGDHRPLCLAVNLSSFGLPMGM